MIIKKQPLISCTRIDTGKSNFNSLNAQDVGTRFEVKSPEGTRREGPPFPHNLSTRVSKIHLQNPNPREEKEEQRGGERGDVRRRAALFWRQEKGEREGEGVKGYLTPTTLNPKD